MSDRETDRQTDTTEIIYHVASLVVNKELREILKEILRRAGDRWRKLLRSHNRRDIIPVDNCNISEFNVL